MSENEMPQGSTVIERFEFRGFQCCRCHCQLELIPLSDGRMVVIATEVEDNPGTSITNVAEYLASFVCGQFHVEPGTLVWIEHYGYGTTSRDRTFDLVTFQRRPAEKISWSPAVRRIHPDGWPGCFDEPDWRPMTDADWRDLGLTVSKPVRYESRRP